MNFSFLYKWALVLGLLLGHVVAVFAQDANIDRAEHVYELFVENQADSIHALLNKNLQEKLPLLRLTSTAAQAQQLNSVSVTSRLSCSLKTVKLLINK